MQLRYRLFFEGLPFRESRLIRRRLLRLSPLCCSVCFLKDTNVVTRGLTDAEVVKSLIPTCTFAFSWYVQINYHDFTLDSYGRSTKSRKSQANSPNKEGNARQGTCPEGHCCFRTRVAQVDLKGAEYEPRRRDAVSDR